MTLTLDVMIHMIGHSRGFGNSGLGRAREQQETRIRASFPYVDPRTGLQLVPLGWGLTTGFVFLWIVRHAVPTRLVGLITLMLAGSSTPAIFTYIFIDSLRVSLLFSTLGTAVGILP